jgi:hypothetical protein
MFLPVPTWACLLRAGVVGAKPRGQRTELGLNGNRRTPRGILPR